MIEELIVFYFGLPLLLTFLFFRTILWIARDIQAGNPDKLSSTVGTILAVAWVFSLMLSALLIFG
ncbi:hypothetical protein MKY84_13445 [Chryseomicrobium sp. FSL W7-1435]|uniref:hypothetical protein n=1 Tax=Chryseomicrobium sp. FSL W7-1435 TaxID=2921704 RepID=UPI00315AD628